jgi:probable rRNA maturation factor
MLKSSSLLVLQIEFTGWSRIPQLNVRLHKAAQRTLATLPKALQFPCTMTLLLTNNKVVQQLNRDFRGKDKPTNVLSFPQYEPRELTKLGKAKQLVYLGDVAIAYQYVVGESKKDHKILINHVTHLLIHGILHLFGYDHISNSKAVRMERLEKRIMAELGLPDPYKPSPQQGSKKRSAPRRKPTSDR